MNFLAPAFLGLAAAALVPLLLHLLRRRIGKTVEFPAARYLVRAERENSRRLRIRNLLLMLLRVATVLLIALAAARPIGRVAGVGHAPTAIAVVVDNSLSSSVIVSGHPLLDELRDAALRVSDQATSADRLWLVTADGEATGGSIAVVRHAMEQLQPLAGSGAMTVALARAISLLEGSGLNERRVALLTDGQRFEWRNVDRIETGDATVAAYVPITTFPVNRSVASVESRPPRWTPSGEIAVRVASPDSVSWRIDIAGRPLARGTAGPGEEIVVRANPHERGWVTGLVEIQPDEFRADDVRHFAAWIGAPPGVATHVSAGPFVRSAVAALEEAGRVAPGSGISVASADETEALPALMFPPSDPVRIGAANRALERLGVPWRYGEANRAAAPVRPASGSGWSDDAVSVSLRYSLEPRPGAASDTVATAGGEPWLVAGDGFVLFASPPDPGSTNLPLRASFIPLIAELLTQRLSGEGGTILQASPAAIVQRPLWADALAESAASSRRLDGSAFAAPTQNGVYFLSRAGQLSGALVVNPPSGEFQFDRMSESELRARFSGDTRVLAEADRWTRVVYESAGRRPLVLPFLFLALGALLVEVMVARDAGARRGG